MQAVIPAPKIRWVKTKDSILWLVLVAVAAVVRLGPITSGLPYFDYIDEGHILHPAIAILKSKSFDSSVYVYPPLTSYLTIGAIKAYAPFYRILHHHKLWKDLPADQDFHTELGERYDLVTPPEIIWLGRFVVACLSIGTVMVAGALAKLLGGSRAGLLAMLLTALCPALVSRGSILILDTTATFFLLATDYFCQRLRVCLPSDNPARWRHAAFAAIAAGLAFGGKFTVGAVFAALLVTILTLPIAGKSKATLIVIAGAGLFIGIFCGVPGAVLHPEKILGEIRRITKDYHTIHSDLGYWSAALSRWEIGLPLMITGLAGIVWMLWKSATRWVAVSWIVFALLLLSALVSSSFQPFRNLLSLVPPLCIAAALLCDRSGEYLAQWDRRLALSHWLAPAWILLVALFLGWSSVRHLQRRTRHIDTRVQAIDWLQRHATKEETVLGIRELGILPAEWKRVAARSMVVPWFEASDLLQRQRFDYVVTGEFDVRYGGVPKAWSVYRDGWKEKAVPMPVQDEAAPKAWSVYHDGWKEKVAPMPVQADFGEVATPVVPSLWRTNEERILILKGGAQ